MSSFMFYLIDFGQHKLLFIYCRPQLLWNKSYSVIKVRKLTLNHCRQHIRNATLFVLFSATTFVCSKLCIQAIQL